MSEQSFKTFLINLDRSPERLAQMTERCDAAGIVFARVNAVDGRCLSDSERQQYDRDGGIAWYGLPMIDNEVACYLSHLKALRAFLDTGAAYGLILEDDTEPDDRSQRILLAIIAECKRRKIQFGFLQAHRNTARTKSQLFKFTQGGQTITISRAHRIGYLAGALLWSREGAEQFLAEHSRIKVPVDIAMATFAAHHQNVLLPSRLIIRQNAHDSDIDDGDPERRSRPLQDYPAFREIDGRRRDREQRIADLARLFSRFGLLKLVWPRFKSAIGAYLNALG
jgi:glycosyl transferase, family 25